MFFKKFFFLFLSVSTLFSGNFSGQQLYIQDENGLRIAQPEELRQMMALGQQEQRFQGQYPVQVEQNLRILQPFQQQGQFLQAPGMAQVVLQPQGQVMPQFQRQFLQGPRMVSVMLQPFQQQGQLSLAPRMAQVVLQPQSEYSGQMVSQFQGQLPLGRGMVPGIPQQQGQYPGQMVPVPNMVPVIAQQQQRQLQQRQLQEEAEARLLQQQQQLEKEKQKLEEEKLKLAQEKLKIEQDKREKEQKEAAEKLKKEQEEAQARLLQQQKQLEKEKQELAHEKSKIEVEKQLQQKQQREQQREKRQQKEDNNTLRFNNVTILQRSRGINEEKRLQQEQLTAEKLKKEQEELAAGLLQQQQQRQQQQLGEEKRKLAQRRLKIEEEKSEKEQKEAAEKALQQQQKDEKATEKNNSNSAADLATLTQSLKSDLKEAEEEKRKREAEEQKQKEEAEKMQREKEQKLKVEKLEQERKSRPVVVMPSHGEDDSLIVFESFTFGEDRQIDETEEQKQKREAEERRKQDLFEMQKKQQQQQLKKPQQAAMAAYESNYPPLTVSKQVNYASATKKINLKSTEKEQKQKLEAERLAEEEKQKAEVERLAKEQKEKEAVIQMSVQNRSESREMQQRQQPQKQQQVQGQRKETKKDKKNKKKSGIEEVDEDNSGSWDVRIQAQREKEKQQQVEDELFEQEEKQKEAKAQLEKEQQAKVEKLAKEKKEADEKLKKEQEENAARLLQQQLEKQEEQKKQQKKSVKGKVHQIVVTKNDWETVLSNFNNDVFKANQQEFLEELKTKIDKTGDGKTKEQRLQFVYSMNFLNSVIQSSKVGNLKEKSNELIEQFKEFERSLHNENSANEYLYAACLLMNNDLKLKSQALDSKLIVQKIIKSLQSDQKMKFEESKKDSQSNIKEVSLTDFFTTCFEIFNDPEYVGDKFELLCRIMRIQNNYSIEELTDKTFQKMPKEWKDRINNAVEKWQQNCSELQKQKIKKIQKDFEDKKLETEKQLKNKKLEIEKQKEAEKQETMQLVVKAHIRRLETQQAMEKNGEILQPMTLQALVQGGQARTILNNVIELSKLREKGLDAIVEQIKDQSEEDVNGILNAVYQFDFVEFLHLKDKVEEELENKKKRSDVSELESIKKFIERKTQKCVFEGERNKMAFRVNDKNEIYAIVVSKGYLKNADAEDIIRYFGYYRENAHVVDSILNAMFKEEFDLLQNIGKKVEEYFNFTLQAAINEEDKIIGDRILLYFEKLSDNNREDLEVLKELTQEYEQSDKKYKLSNLSVECLSNITELIVKLSQIDYNIKQSEKKLIELDNKNNSALLQEVIKFIQNNQIKGLESVDRYQYIVNFCNKKSKPCVFINQQEQQAVGALPPDTIKVDISMFSGDLTLNGIMDFFKQYVPEKECYHDIDSILFAMQREKKDLLIRMNMKIAENFKDMKNGINEKSDQEKIEYRIAQRIMLYGNEIIPKN